ncbi:MULTISPECIES: tetratricopeptide repeat protein [unclassified Nostoc]|uniref:tetratricopeptide repeat protein n=1 Tax=unclassified Nostoc TaxID=2593658 RepID=UPI002AD304A7|nr:tetratricopeptide repeat protein [Nostoc sp. DedQUE03]MDZ7971137.1 tetratricopeptide repeat protein [Nostoc sp. DedQUE03]MDZ8044297.1 tetratricopeptide repeat protein [Nostoc sp. DedQUE02]
MDWITLLRSLQSDFIKRLASGCLLHCETEGQYSELTIISGERLKALREFCWLMAEKYKRVLPVRDVFLSYLKGKLGEEVVKERLADFITEVDYEKRFGGDGNIDFTLTSDPSIGIEVKSRHGRIDRVRWSISSEEVEKNAVVVCILIQEDVSEAQSEYHLFLAGFLPTRMIKLKTGKISFGIEQLLYGGGLWCYLEQLQSSVNNYSRQQLPIYKYLPKQEISSKLTINQAVKSPFQPEHSNENLNKLYIQLGDEYFDKAEYTNAITKYNQALEANHSDANLYYKRGLAHYQIGDYEVAIADYSQAIQMNIHDAKSYNKRGLALYQLGRLEEAINDYTQAIRINPHVAIAYKNRAEARSQIGDNQGAIEDYTQAIKINPNYVDAYKNRGIARYLLGSQSEFSQAIKINPQNAIAYKKRGNARSDLGDFQGAIEDYTQVIQINFNYADAYYNRANARLEIADKQGAIEDFQKAADIYRKEGKLEALKDTRERILDLEIEESLDILNF